MNLPFCDRCDSLMTVRIARLDDGDARPIKQCAHCDNTQVVDDLYEMLYDDESCAKNVPWYINKNSVHDPTLARTSEIKCVKGCDADVICFDTSEDRVSAYMCTQCYEISTHNQMSAE
jgi:hypothetical protein